MFLVKHLRIGKYVRVITLIKNVDLIDRYVSFKMSERDFADLGCNSLCLTSLFPVTVKFSLFRKVNSVSDSKQCFIICFFQRHHSSCDEWDRDAVWLCRSLRY